MINDDPSNGFPQTHEALQEAFKRGAKARGEFAPVQRLLEGKLHKEQRALDKALLAIARAQGDIAAKQAVIAAQEREVAFREGRIAQLKAAL